jgi:hypothetical protein
MLDLTFVPDFPSNGWKERHLRAVAHPTGFERPIVFAFRSWIDYAKEHEKEYGTTVGKDGVLGHVWRDLGLSIHGLLDGSTGRLDCGTLSTIINKNLTEQGFPQ